MEKLEIVMETMCTCFSESGLLLEGRRWLCLPLPRARVLRLATAPVSSLVVLFRATVASAASPSASHLSISRSRLLPFPFVLIIVSRVGIPVFRVPPAGVRRILNLFCVQSIEFLRAWFGLCVALMSG